MSIMHLNRNEQIVHPECDCLHVDDVMSDDCRKRWFHVSDIENGTTKYIGVCNQHLSLLIQSESLKRTGNTWANKKSLIYSSIVKTIISNYVSVESISNFRRGGNNYNELSNRSIAFYICDRPFLHRDISLIDCIEILLKGGFNWEVKNKVVNSIVQYLESKDTYKKYKTKYKESVMLCKKLQKSHGDERENIINQIFINILELNIKTK